MISEQLRNGICIETYLLVQSFSKRIKLMDNLPKYAGLPYLYPITEWWSLFIYLGLHNSSNATRKWTNSKGRTLFKGIFLKFEWRLTLRRKMYICYMNIVLSHPVLSIYICCLGWAHDS